MQRRASRSSSASDSGSSRSPSPSPPPPASKRTHQQQPTPATSIAADVYQRLFGTRDGSRHGLGSSSDSRATQRRRPQQQDRTDTEGRTLVGRGAAKLDRRYKDDANTELNARLGPANGGSRRREGDRDRPTRRHSRPAVKEESWRRYRGSGGGGDRSRSRSPRRSRSRSPPPCSPQQRPRPPSRSRSRSKSRSRSRSVEAGEVRVKRPTSPPPTTTTTSMSPLESRAREVH
ncbi:hypothetical protein BC828DRAFT_391603, partial [Blastocladiella britannica]